MRAGQGPAADDRALPRRAPGDEDRPAPRRASPLRARHRIDPAGHGLSRYGKAGLRSPEQTARVFAAALGSGDLDTATACFARDGCFLTPDATAIRGRDDIRPILAQMLAGCTSVRIDMRSMISAGEVALGSELWTLGSKGPDGVPFERASTSLVVLRRVEGDWKLTIAAPWAEGTPAL